MDPSVFFVDDIQQSSAALKANATFMKPPKFDQGMESVKRILNL